jgi:hypothetical protein
MLLDNSGLLSYHHAGEATHKAAKRLFKAWRRQLTHDYVLAEFPGSCECAQTSALIRLEICENPLEHPRIEIVWVDELAQLDELRGEGVRLGQLR